MCLLNITKWIFSSEKNYCALYLLTVLRKYHKQSEIKINNITYSKGYTHTHTHTCMCVCVYSDTQCECVFRQVQEKCSSFKHSYSHKCKKRTYCKEWKCETQSVYGQLFSSPDLLGNVNNTVIHCCSTVRQNQKGIPKNSVDYETKQGDIHLGKGWLQPTQWRPNKKLTCWPTCIIIPTMGNLVMKMEILWHQAQ